MACMIAQLEEHCSGIASWVRIPFKPEFFSSFFFRNCLSILTASVFLLFDLSSAVENICFICIYIYLLLVLFSSCSFFEPYAHTHDTVYRSLGENYLKEKMKIVVQFKYFGFILLDQFWLMFLAAKNAIPPIPINLKTFPKELYSCSSQKTAFRSFCKIE